MSHMILYFAFFTLLQGDPADKSVCGFNMTNPLWVNTFFGMLVWSGAELTARLSCSLVKKVPPASVPLLPGVNIAPLLAPMMKLLSSAIGLSMVGFVIIPRCLFDAHQIFVLGFMWGGLFLMLLVLIFYPDIEWYAVLGYVASCYVCWAYYEVGGYEFMIGNTRHSFLTWIGLFRNIICCCVR